MFVQVFLGSFWHSDLTLYLVKQKEEEEEKKKKRPRADFG
jgi:hypothetical protein